MNEEEREKLIQMHEKGIRACEEAREATRRAMVMLWNSWDTYRTSIGYILIRFN